MITALGDQPADLIVELGEGVPVRTAAVEAIVLYKGDIVPKLKAAFGSENSTMVGYAAFCLGLLNYNGGRCDALIALARIESRNPQTFEDRFAISSLRNYIDFTRE